MTPLPQDAPPTGLQAPVPAPALPIPRPDHPAEMISRLAGQPLTVNDVIAIALATNRQLAFAGEALYREQGIVSEARAALNPTLGLSAGPTYLASSLQPGGIAAATMPFDTSGALRAANSQTQFQEVASRLDINRIRDQIVFDVKGAFYNVLRAEALVGVATENLQNSLDRLKDADTRYQVRAVPYFDVILA